MNTIKKSLAILLAICMLFGVAACGKTTEADENGSQAKTEAVQPTGGTTNKTQPNVTTANNDIGGGTPGLLKYRSIYYEIPHQFMLIVGKPAFNRWSSAVSHMQNGENAERMLMSLFIERFNITREEFDKANYAWAKFIKEGFKEDPMLEPKDYANQETAEVYNADIIYSFDDDKIRDYYLGRGYPYCYVTDYEEALESGEYQTRTTKWIDVDKFEKEIIQKYGSTKYEQKLMKQRKFRVSYYDVALQFQELVSAEEYETWQKSVYADGFDNVDEMVIVSFIKHFNISREDFDKANKHWARIIQDMSGKPSTYNPYDYPEQEYYELYNADIIYTFDNAKIDEYYREHDYAYNTKEECEKAIAAGTYKSKADGYILAIDNKVFSVSDEPFELPEEAQF